MGRMKGLRAVGAGVGTTSGMAVVKLVILKQIWSDLRRNYMVQCRWASAMYQYNGVGYAQILKLAQDFSVVRFGHCGGVIAFFYLGNCQTTSVKVAEDLH